MTLVAWHCSNCGRYEAEPSRVHRCPKCGRKSQRCSRYEWFLSDALGELIEASGIVGLKLYEQYPVRDHRGFVWFWDLAVEREYDWGVRRLFIDINGPSHDTQKKYEGGGYTRDYDKAWETRHTAKNSDIIILTNDECTKAAARATASRVLGRLGIK